MEESVTTSNPARVQMVRMAFTSVEHLTMALLDSPFKGYVLSQKEITPDLLIKMSREIRRSSYYGKDDLAELVMITRKSIQRLPTMSWPILAEVNGWGRE